MNQTRLALLSVALAACLLSAAQARTVEVASFNIKFLGLYKNKENAILAKVLAPYDLVFVQELVAPPYTGTYPDGSPFVPDQESAAFFDAMLEQGFKFATSEEDTGRGKKNHNNGSATEWAAAFYKPEAAELSGGLPSGFISTAHTANPHYDRVPVAFPFRFSGGADMVFIPVHLRQGSGPANRAQRSGELSSIKSWINSHDMNEHDFVILGDMNLQNCAGIADATPSSFTALNAGDECLNTNVKDSHPFDNVVYRVNGEKIDTAYGMKVDDLTGRARAAWGRMARFPKDSKFEQAFSDHNPVHFQLNVGSDDD